MRQGAFQRGPRAHIAGSRRGPTVVGALLVGLALAGCTTTEAAPEPVRSEAVTAPTPTTPPTPAPTTAAPVPPAPPEPPPAMDRPDEAGAIAAAEYFLALSQYAVQSGQLDLWQQFTAQDCRYCTYVTQTVQEARERDVRLVGGDLTIRNAELVAVDSALGVYAVSITYDATSLMEVASDGSEAAVSPAGAGVLTVEVVPVMDGWRLVGVVSQEST